MFHWVDHSGTDGRNQTLDWTRPREKEGEVKHKRGREEEIERKSERESLGERRIFCSVGMHANDMTF